MPAFPQSKYLENLGLTHDFGPKQIIFFVHLDTGTQAPFNTLHCSVILLANGGPWHGFALKEGMQGWINDNGSLM